MSYMLPDSNVLVNIVPDGDFRFRLCSGLNLETFVMYVFGQ